jgi:glycosyltransferase involved in cell wall biosynthesis
MEVIIVDDGSTDNTETLIEKLLDTIWKGKPIRYHKQKNAGASAARNKGIELALGEFIQFLDSDDLLHPDKLLLQIECLKKDKAHSPVGCSCFGLLGLGFNDVRAPRIGIQCDSPHEFILKLCGRLVHGMQTSAPLWKSSFIKSQPGWRTDISLGDDLEYHIRLLTKAKQISFVERELFLVRLHDGERLSIVNNNTPKIESSIRTKKAIFETIQKANLWDMHMQKIFLRSLRTTYENVLEYCDKKQIIEFENWLKKVSTKPNYNILFHLIIFIRKTLGKNTILKSHQIIAKLRK